MKLEIELPEDVMAELDRQEATHSTQEMVERVAWGGSPTSGA
jgi:hypothetical protein